MDARRHMAQVGRIGFAQRITADEFAADPDAGAYVAYVAARANTRREFTTGGRDNVVDHLAAMLLERCRANPDTNWWMVAQITPTTEVLARLDDASRGALLGDWWSEMSQAGELLAILDADTPVDRATMIVRRGCDSDTWNLAAGAFNRARAAWISIVSSLGAFAVLNEVCPPKAMKVMAADLIYWHTRSGGSLTHPDVAVAARLPAAWDVVADRATCVAGDVAAACAEVGVDPLRSGWLAPRPAREVAEFHPTPELVHGITVADPLLAAVLRRGKVFSGRPLTGDVHEVLDRLAGEGGPEPR